MITSKTESVRPLLESTSGIHLTAYIKNNGDINDLKKQLRNSIEVADEYLVPVMSVKEIEKFFAPIHLLIKDEKRLKHFTRNLAIFRTPTSFRVLNLPIDVDSECIVADSFHIKPLLKWMQVDREFLLLGLDRGSATLYQGSMHSLKAIDTILFPNTLTREMGFGMSYQDHKNLREMMEYLNGWILTLTGELRPRLFVAGEKEMTNIFLKTTNYENTSRNPIWPSFSHKKIDIICAEVRAALVAEARKAFELELVEFHYATQVNRAKGNVFAIAKAAVQGKIRKLLISDGIKVFGKLDRKNGELAIHQTDIDHEDDDILDDLAQLVLAHGGEVVVASRGEIPRGRAILAIIDEPSHLEAVKQNEYKFQPELNVRSAL